MRTVPVGTRYEALVDDDDYDLVAQYRWYAMNWKRSRTVYAYRFVGRDGEANPTRHVPRTLQFMHKMLTGYDQTDHKNGNGLDNQRSNLRPASSSQNKQNRPKARGNYSSPYKGVSRSKRGYWEAYIKRDGRIRHLGHFDDEQEAARAYDTAARELFGEYARLNFEPVSAIDG